MKSLTNYKVFVCSVVTGSTKHQNQCVLRRRFSHDVLLKSRTRLLSSAGGHPESRVHLELMSASRRRGVHSPDSGSLACVVGDRSAGGVPTYTR